MDPILVLSDECDEKKAFWFENIEFISSNTCENISCPRSGFRWPNGFDLAEREVAVKNCGNWLLKCAKSSSESSSESSEPWLELWLRFCLYRCAGFGSGGSETSTRRSNPSFPYLS